MNLKFDVKKIQSSLNILVINFKRHSVFIFIITVLAVYGFLVFQINRLSSVEPSQENINQKLDNVSHPRIDQDSVNKLENLQDQNVRVQTLFKSARDNPFQE